MAIIDPGDEVVIFEPFYENYGPDAILSGATPRYVTLHEPDWTFDPERARRPCSRQDQGRHHQHAEQPDGEGLHARRARDDRGALSQVGRHRHLGRESTSTSSTTAAATSRWRPSKAWRTAR